MTATCMIEGFGPLPVSVPSAIAEVGELIRQTASKHAAVYPLSGRTQLSYGYPPVKPGIGVDLSKLTQVIDYPARDMTITVQAGITFADLQAVLRTEKQRLPIDVPLADQATLGGILATNTSGPRRYAFGTLRDYVIGISVINDEGQEVKAGGRVVKNVAGYDLCKLYIGSLGTLGIITQVTLKLKPQPENRALILAVCDSRELEAALEAIHVSATRPVCFDLFNGLAVKSMSESGSVPPSEFDWLVIVGFEDNRQAVDWQVQQLLQELAKVKCGTFDPLRNDTSAPLWDFMTEFQLRADATLTFKANLLPREVAAFCMIANGLSERPLLQAHAGSGVILGHFGAELTLSRAQAILKELQDTAEAGMGNVIVQRCPPGWKRELPIWGRPRGDAWLMRRVKELLDPKGIFNPGRFIVAI
jgi:glycolate oxidase FAD binding subunit